MKSSPIRLNQLPPPPPPAAAAGLAAGTVRPAPKKKSFLGRLVTWTVVGGLILYPAGAWVSTQNEAVRDQFVQLPGGEWLADYADENNWEQFGVGTITQQVAKLTKLVKGESASTTTPTTTTPVVEEKVDRSIRDLSGKKTSAADELRARAEAATRQVKDAVAPRTEGDATTALAEIGEAWKRESHEAGQRAASIVRETAAAIKDDAKALAGLAEDKAAALKVKAGKAADEIAGAMEDVAAEVTNPYVDTQKPRALRPETVTPAARTHEGEEKWGQSLPIGYEPPPGYYVPAAPKPKVPEAGEKLPLLAPKVKDFGSEEPIISQLASTIDSLTSSLSSTKGGPSTEAAGILDKATRDLSSLNERLGEVKKTEQQRLQQTVEAKTREFEQQLAVKEKEWQKDEAGLKETWEAERQKMVDGWRDVLNGELETQRQSIEQR